MMRTLIDIVHLEGTLVVICDIFWSLLFAGNLIMESFIIGYLWQFIHDPIRYGNHDKLIFFLKQGNKDLPCFNSAWQRVGVFTLLWVYETECQSFVLLWFCGTECHSFALLDFCEAKCQSFALLWFRGTGWQNFAFTCLHGSDCQRSTLESVTSLKRLGALVKGSSQAINCLATLRLPEEYYKNWTRHRPFDDTSSCSRAANLDKPNLRYHPTAFTLDKPLFQTKNEPSFVFRLKNSSCIPDHRIPGGAYSTYHIPSEPR